MIAITRRLEPMDRIDELGDASVPFWFDVHAMVFSSNRPAQQYQWAQGVLSCGHCRDRKNIRENYDAVVEFTHEAPAELYRESLRMTAKAKDTGTTYRDLSINH